MPFQNNKDNISTNKPLSKKLLSFLISNNLLTSLFNNNLNTIHDLYKHILDVELKEKQKIEEEERKKKEEERRKEEERLKKIEEERIQLEHMYKEGLIKLERDLINNKNKQLIIDIISSLKDDNYKIKSTELLKEINSLTYLNYNNNEVLENFIKYRIIKIKYERTSNQHLRYSQYANLRNTPPFNNDITYYDIYGYNYSYNFGSNHARFDDTSPMFICFNPDIEQQKLKFISELFKKPFENKKQISNINIEYINDFIFKSDKNIGKENYDKIQEHEKRIKEEKERVIEAERKEREDRHEKNKIEYNLKWKEKLEKEKIENEMLEEGDRLSEILM